MNKEAFISLLKVNSLKTEKEINTITNRYTNYDPPAIQAGDSHEKTVNLFRRSQYAASTAKALPIHSNCS